MKLCDIYLKHWLLFDYDLSECAGYVAPLHVFPISSSIHFKAIKSNQFDIYEKLIKTTQQREHSVAKFKNLIKNFDIIKMPPIEIRFNKRLKKFLIEDGCHRLSIIKDKKIFKDSIPDKHLKIK